MPLRVKPREKLLPDVLTPELIAPCGMDCGLCMVYVRDKHGCLGCRAGDEGKAKSCLACSIRNCETIQAGESAFCGSDLASRSTASQNRGECVVTMTWCSLAKTRKASKRMYWALGWRNSSGSSNSSK